MSDQSRPVEPDGLHLYPPAGTRMLVVGGCGGIGRVLVQAAMSAGLEVAVMDLQRSIGAAKPPAGVRAIPLDVTDPESVNAAFADLTYSWDGFGVLVNLAGYATERIPVEQLTAEQWDEVVAVSLRGTYLVARRALRMIRQAGGGSIIHTASGLATNVMPGYGPYSAAKAGVIALTKALARENAPTIRANAIAPGAVDTEFLTGGTGRPRQTPQIDLESYVKSIPMGRIAQAADIVGPIMFLAGPASRFVSGQTLYINGAALTP